MDILKLKDIIVRKNRVEYDYDYNGIWTDALKQDEKFYLEYDMDISSVPKSILVIPFLCNILPISWVFNLKIETFEIDKEFSNCINDLKVGYQGMFPKIRMKGELSSNNVVLNKHQNDKSGTLFSGGVDAFCTLLNHIDEKPNLLTIWGADINLDDLVGWQKVDEHHKKVAEQFDLEYNYIKSNLKNFLNYAYLFKYVSHFTNDEWWHGFQHGIGILGIMAPLAYIKHFGKIYIASSFTAEYKGQYTCASDPTIDNYLKFGSCKVIHDGYELNRQDKIHNICEYADTNKLTSIPVRVCWESTGGENCCICEKCTRTIMGFLAEKRNPNNFGFDFTENKRKQMIKRLKKYSQYTYRYVCIQKKLIENYSIDETPKDLMKFRNMKIKTTIPRYIRTIKKINSIPRRVLSKIKRVLIKHIFNR